MEQRGIFSAAWNEVRALAIGIFAPVLTRAEKVLSRVRPMFRVRCDLCGIAGPFARSPSAAVLAAMRSGAWYSDDACTDRFVCSECRFDRALVCHGPRKADGSLAGGCPDGNAFELGGSRATTDVEDRMRQARTLGWVDRRSKLEAVAGLTEPWSCPSCAVHDVAPSARLD